MVTIIDYGIGNLRSIEKAFQAVGVEVLRTDRPADLARADRLVLPGVGAFGACADEIRRRGLEAPILDAVERGVPFLGVCVGMQLLFEASEERGTHRGLGILPGRVVRFPGPLPAEPLVPASGAVEEPALHAQAASLEAARPSALQPAPRAGGVTPPQQPASLKVPHMGWNNVTPHAASPLLDGIDAEAYFYFVHSYYAAPAHAGDVLASAVYGDRFPAIVWRNNVLGVQFHPEKSQRNGLRVLENFATM